MEFAGKNTDTYPDFHAFANMMKSRSCLWNYPNVTATDMSGKWKEKSKIEDHHTVLKGETEIEEQEDDTKHCAFHDRQGHNLSECRAFEHKTLHEKMDWLREAGRCFRCLQLKHLARKCKASIKCNKCGSKHHLDILHMEKLKKKDSTEEITSAHTNVKYQPISRVSCSKIVLVEVFQQDESNHVIEVYVLIDEQSNSSMISPKVADEFKIVRPKEKYFLSTCGGSKETRHG